MGLFNTQLGLQADKKIHIAHTHTDTHWLYQKIVAELHRYNKRPAREKHPSTIVCNIEEYVRLVLTD